MGIDSGEDWIAVSHLTGKEVHRYSQGEWIQTELVGEWLHFDNEVMVGSPTTGWTHNQVLNLQIFQQ